MDVFEIIFYLFLFSLLITGITALIFGSRGPWGSYWSTFLVIFLFVWATSLWIEPVGPVYYGIYWIPIIVMGIFMAILLIAVTPPYYRYKRRNRIKQTNSKSEESETTMALGFFFWLSIAILLVAIIGSYWA